MPRSTCATTGVVSVSVLFVGLPSLGCVTVAVFVYVPGAVPGGTSTFTTRVATPPTPSSDAGMEQVSACPATEQPAGCVALHTRQVGRSSTTVAFPTAADVPTLRTVRV